MADHRYRVGGARASRRREFVVRLAGALAYADGMFLSVGQWFDAAPDGKQVAFAYASRSSNGINWESIDLRSSLGSLHPTQLVRFGGRWIMAAESWDATGPPQTPLYSSIDGATWERIASLDFKVAAIWYLS